MITVANCSEVSEALLFKSLLQSNGIVAFVPDELTAQNIPAYSWANGGIRVQVRDEDAEVARSLLAGGKEDTEVRAAIERGGQNTARPEKVNLAEKFSSIQQHWSPRIAAELNGQHVKLVKFAGEFVWHQHAEEDELFLVVDGSFRMEFRDRTVELNEGEMLVVPRGVEHRPVADREVSVLLFEPVSTVNTGSAGGDRTVAKPEWV